MASEHLDVNLPSTLFPLEGKLLVERQDDILRTWQAMRIYHSILEDRRDADPFVLHDGPPYAAGDMHVGIGFNKILKDVVAKYWSMRGRRVAFVPGWDCHGLPIEAKVLDDLRARDVTPSPSEIRARCAASADAYIREQNAQFQRLGIFADWSRPYVTMAPSYEAAVLDVLADVVRKGYVYRAERAVNWCAACRAVLADAEVEPDGPDGPRCSRCGKAVAQRSMPQWFVALDRAGPDGSGTLRERALEEVELVRWLPPTAKARMSTMIRERPDWCISRQRHWGVPIPAVCCRTCGTISLIPDVIHNARDLVATHGSGAWFTVDLGQLLPPAFTCPECGGTDFERGTDVLDVWFESAASWHDTLIGDHRLSFPADLCVEGTDQHRGWFQLSLLTSLMVRGVAPFRAVLTHGFVTNTERKRMSKSRGDLVTLDQVLARVPVDLLRLFLVWKRDINEDIPLSIPAIQAVAPEYRTFRSCFRYLLGNLYDYEPSEHVVPLGRLLPVDAWILGRLHEVINRVTEDYAAYGFRSALEQLYEFCNDTLSRFYFEVAKDRLYNEAATSSARRSAQTAMHALLVGLVKMLAPVLVYTCEEVWRLCPGRTDCPSVHMSQWPSPAGSISNSDAGRAIDRTYRELWRVRQAIQPNVQKAREEGLIGETAQAAVTLYADPADEQRLDTFLAEHRAALRDCLGVSELAIATVPDGTESVADLNGLRCRVAPSGHPQCRRCRRYDATVGADALRPGLCARCIGVLEYGPPLGAPRMTGPISADIAPADLAAYMRASDLRRVALMPADGGHWIAYYFHRAAQRVRPHPGLQALADYIARSPNVHDHAGVLLGLGENTDVLFGIGIHKLNYGTPLGGTREFSYEHVGDLLDNLLRLSYGMSVKNAIAELPHGGGKSIIDTSGLDLKVHREQRRHIYRDFGQFTASLFGRYICAEDMNNTTADTREMLAMCRHVMCLSEGVGGSGNPSRFTALVAWVAAKAAWQSISGTSSLDGLTIAIQGAGNVARNVVDILTEGEPGLERILIADNVPEQIDSIRKMLQRKGKVGLLEVRDWRQGPSDERGARGTYILHADCDILILAAVGNVISPESVERLRCKLIVPIANNVYSDNDRVAQRIFEAGIVDATENNVNWGGAMAAASELYGYDEDQCIHAALRAYEKTLELLAQARDRGVPPWEIIKQRAAERIDHEQHPVVKAARQYGVDISRDFASWVTDRWLPGITGVGAESFAHHAVALFEAARGRGS